MVVLAAAVITKPGRTLVARTFVEITRLRLEGLLAAFPKLLGSGDSQHTYIDTENIRYLYQPMENLYMLLICNKASNIVEDLDTLRLLAKLTADVASGVTEEAVSNACFEIAFAFDEAVTQGGYKENASLAQIHVNLEMESHEEKLHMMIMKSKKEAAVREAKLKATSIKEAQREKQRMERAAGIGGVGMGGRGPMQGIGSDSAGGGGSGMGGNAYGGATEAPVYNAPSSPSTPPPAPARSGMKLGGASRGQNLMAALAKEDNLSAAVVSGGAPASSAAASSAAAAAAAASSEPVSMTLEEKMSVQLNREGTLEAMEVKGVLTLTVNSEQHAKCAVQLSPAAMPGLTFQTHPKVSKPDWEASSALQLKGGAAFPVQRPVGVLRWVLKTADQSLLPITINCWPEEEGGGQVNVNIEYSLEQAHRVLHDVQITIPGCYDQPSIVNVDGVHAHNAKEGTMLWSMDMIDASNKTGSLEFNIPSRDTDAFFPLNVSFSSSSLFTDSSVQGVVDLATGGPVRYGESRLLATDSFVVQ